MLSETLVPPTHFEELRKLRWSIHAPSESSGHFILPDCVAIARSATAITYEPLILASVGEADIVVMPISKRRLLVGSRGQFGSCAALPTINVDLAKCSFEFFVSSQLDSDTKALKNLIGSRIAALSADPLEQQKAPIAPPKKLVCELAKVHVKTPIGRTGDSIKTAISKLAQEAVSPECASYLESIVVANDMAQALQTLSGHALTANQIEKAATHGSVEPVRRGGEWRIRVLVPRTIGQALAQQNASAEHQAAAAILRLLFGRAHYFTCWASQCQQVVAGVDPEMDAWSASTLHLTLRAGGSYVSGLSLGRSGVKATFETEQWAPRATPYLSCAAELINAREHALKDGNVDRLIADAMPPIEILLDVVATVCGIEKSSGAQLLHTSELGLALQRAGLSEWVSLLARDLDQHWSSRSFWESRSDLKTLTAHIERLLWTIGVVVSPTETGHWIDVLDTNLAAVFANTLRQ